jgi:hypothetical protein
MSQKEREKPSLPMFHVYHNDCSPRAFANFDEAEKYADEVMEEATNNYKGTKFIKEDSKMRISYHAMFDRKDPHRIEVYDNMYNLSKIKDNNKLFRDKNNQILSR